MSLPLVCTWDAAMWSLDPGRWPQNEQRWVWAKDYRSNCRCCAAFEYHLLLRSVEMEPLRRRPLLEFTLDSKRRRIWARSYFVLETYAGILEGTPDEEFNERMLRDLPDRLRPVFGSLPVHILEPTLVRSELASNWRGHEIFLLPPICIAATFTSAPARDESMHASSLTIAWFQDHDLPIVSAENQSRLSKTMWETMAVDFEY